MTIVNAPWLTGTDVKVTAWVLLGEWAWILWHGRFDELNTLRPSIWFEVEEAT